MIYRAILFDGQNAKAHDALVHIEGDFLEISLPGRKLTYRPEEYEVGTTFRARCYIDCNDGTRLEIDDPNFAAAILQRQGLLQRTVATLTKHLALVLPALLLAVGAVYFLLIFGVPVAAAALAKTSPEKTERLIGRYITESAYVNSTFFQPSTLAPQRQLQITQRLAAYCRSDAHCPPYRLLFKNSAHFGSNAFALPGGDIIVTDSLVALASNDHEISAVLAHELGHVAHRHSLQRLFESSLRALVLIGITGDVDSLASVLPSLMFDLRYSRKLETDADRFALDFMLRHCIPPSAFASIMDKMSGSEAGSDATGISVSNLLSTHPGLRERTRSFKEATARDCPAPLL